MVRSSKVTAGQRIEICGGIASGKTTLAHLLEEFGCQIKHERFAENPFWQLFYQDPPEYAFATEVTFLLQHYVQIKSATESSLLVCDFSLIQDCAYADINLVAGQFAAFDRVFRQASGELSPPTLLIHLQCSPKEELKRIRLRNRSEERTIKPSYLERLNKAIARRVAALPKRTRILTIDSEANNFATDRAVQIRTTKDILNAIPGHTRRTLLQRTGSARVQAAGSTVHRRDAKAD